MVEGKCEIKYLMLRYTHCGNITFNHHPSQAKVKYFSRSTIKFTAQIRKWDEKQKQKLRYWQ